MEPSKTLTPGEEATKKNTDCIYFLASPFTCKKGNECEFRHTEGARNNPRDCWYWMNGNCMNPKCAFRHPPLDGLFGFPGAPSGPLPSSVQTMAHAPGAYNPNKQSVPCYYFQKGQCIKGDRCAFLHGPQPTSNYAAEQATNGPHPAGNNTVQDAPKVSSSFTGTSRTISWGIKECNNNIPQTIPKTVVDKPVEVLQSSTKSATSSEAAHLMGPPLRKSPSPYPLDYYEPHHHQPLLEFEEENYSNGRDADELLGESSPGFDVLVENDEQDYARDEYYQNEDDYGRAFQNPSDYDYEAVANFERDQYDNNRKDEYDHYARDHLRASSERRDMDRRPKRRPMHRESRSPDERDGLDLRHRLSKQRRINPSRRDDRYVEDRYSGRSSSRREGSFSSRLLGRITLPVRSSPDRSIERDRESGRSRKRFSPTRRTNYKGRAHDRISRMPDEDFNANGSSGRVGSRSSRSDDGDPFNFAGPKSLAELKGAKSSGSYQEQKIKSIIAPPEDPVSFEGPKPLSDILKRKRESASGNGSALSSGDEGNYNASSVKKSKIQAAEVGDDTTVDATEEQQLENDEDLKTEDGDENAYHDDENGYLDDEKAYQDDEDDDEDEFAKRVGNLFS